VTESRRPPLVLLPACHRITDGRVFHATPAEYSDALRLAGCQPLLVTAECPDELFALLEIADGMLLPGSPNNVHPSHFGEEIHDLSLPLDPKRDALSLPLIREALSRGIPLLGICRGHQEINVALGGSLHQAVHEVPGHDNHQPHGDDPPDLRYAPAHEIRITPGGLLERLLGGGPILVNSVHGQAVHHLAPGLRVEAPAPDGTIEAIHAPDAPGFNLGVQWHPEWQAAGNPASEAIFHAFGDACRDFQT
jgi:putative glutamine amidotransferase